MIDTSEILVSKEHIDPLRDQGFVIYKLGRIDPVTDGKREAHMLWGNVKGGAGVAIPTITEIVKTIQSDNHESFLIENTANASETVESSWTVLPYNQQVGEFKAVVMVRNKSLNTIITMMNILSFDYSDAVKVVQQNPMLIDANITLTTGVNEANKLYATVSGMTADAKRIHLCFERCVLGKRYIESAATFDFATIMAANITSYLNGKATGEVSLNGNASLSSYLQMNSVLSMKLDIFSQISLLLPEVNFTIEDLFPSIVAIVNEEHDAYTEGTLLQIVAFDNIEHTVQVSYIPDEMELLSVINPTPGKEWALAVPNPSAAGGEWAIKITGGNLETKILTFEPVVATFLENFVPGAYVHFVNIYNNGWENGIIINKAASTYYSQMIGPGGVYRHSDGTYRMVTNGYNETGWQVGLFSSPDLKTWTSVSTNAKITYGISWALAGIHVSAIIKHPTEDKYFGLCYGESTNDSTRYYQIGWVKFDENMENIEYGIDPLVSTVGTVSGVYSGSIIYYGGKYRIYVCHRNTIFQIKEWQADLPEGPYALVGNMIDQTSPAIVNTTTLYRNTSSETFPFVLNGKLHSIIDGTGYWDNSSNKLFRQFGILEYDDLTGTWIDNNKGIVIGTYAAANSIWGTEYYGHSGGSPILYFNYDGICHFYASFTYVSDAYQVFSMKKRLWYPKLTRQVAGDISTLSPALTGTLIDTASGTTLLAGLMSAWEFDETSGTTAYDFMGIKNLTHNFVDFVAGKLGGAYLGVGKSITGGTSDFNMGAGQDFTISMWLKFGSWSYTPYIISKRYNAGDGLGWFVFYESRSGYVDNNGISRTNAITFAIDCGSTYLQLSSGPASVPYGNTNDHHIVCYRRGTTMGLILDGGTPNEYTNAALAVSLANTTAFMIFRSTAGAMNGTLDQTAIWNRALISEEIAVLNNSNNGLALANW